MRIAHALLISASIMVTPAGAMAQSPDIRAECYEPERQGPLVELQVGDRLSAVIAPALGGQLVGLRYRQRGHWHELLYRGLDFCSRGGWSGKAPILWPATGRNYVAGAPGGQGWMFEGQLLPMPTHGFARDLPWRLVAQRTGRGMSSATVELTDTPQTRKAYPFGFTFAVTYRLSRTQLLIEHVIVASLENGSAMPFSIGNHITFRQPLAGAGSMTISTPARQRLALDPSGKPHAQEPQAPLRHFPVADLGRETALPLLDYPDDARVDLSDPGGISIRLSHRASAKPDGNVVLFNLWGNADRGFFSPEPWFGRQNSLADDIGVIRLAPGDRFRWIVAVQVRG